MEKLLILLPHTAAVDFDGTKNVNVAAENAAVIDEMAEHAKAWFGCNR